MGGGVAAQAKRGRHILVPPKPPSVISALMSKVKLDSMFTQKRKHTNTHVGRLRLGELSTCSVRVFVHACAAFT